MEAVEGETVRFRCKVRAYPPPRVMWFKDGKKLVNGENYTVGEEEISVISDFSVIVIIIYMW